MKILITGLLALLITSKVNAQNLDKNMTSIPNCWKAGKDGGMVSTNYQPCITAYYTCLLALEDETSIGNHPLSYYTDGSTDCADTYGNFYPVSNLKTACIDKWDEYCHNKKVGIIHHAHLRNECRRKYEAICAAIYRTFGA